jgi:hypothetical protein
MTNLSRVNVSAQTNGIAKRKKRRIGRTSTSTAKTKKLDDFQDLIQMELLRKIEFQLIEKMLLQILSTENSFPSLTLPKVFFVNLT